MSSRDVDVAIVGGGIAGLYAAWRLTQAGGRGVHLFETSDRLGGRIRTLRTPCGSPAELGARNVRADHTLLLGLLQKFGIATAPLNQQAGGLIHLRGRTKAIAELRHARWLRPFRYAVAPRLQRGVGRLVAKAMGGGEAPESGLHDFLKGRLSGEEIAYLCDISGYDFWLSDVDARETLRWWQDHLSAGGRQLSVVPEGLDTLVQRLAEDIVARGGTISLRTPLARLEPAGPDGGGLRLTFEGVEGGGIRAGSVILALPAAAVGAITGVEAVPGVDRLLGAVERRGVISAALVYESCWWRELGFASGPSVTDLPLGVLNHFGAESWRTGPAGQGTISIFAEGRRATRWTGKAGLDAGWLPPAHPLAGEMQRMIAEAYRPRLRRDPPTPVACVVTDWSASPSGGAYHLWRAGSRPSETAQLAFRPSKSIPLHICGEAWSTNQAWIEGALHSTRQMLDRHFPQP
jgi:monoamine oxidase